MGADRPRRRHLASEVALSSSVKVGDVRHGAGITYVVTHVSLDALATLYCVDADEENDIVDVGRFHYWRLFTVERDELIAPGAT